MSWIEDFYDSIVNNPITGYPARYGIGGDQKEQLAQSGQFGPYWSGTDENRYLADRAAGAHMFGKKWGPRLGYFGTDVATNVANQISEGARAVIPGGRGYSGSAVDVARNAAQNAAINASQPGQAEQKHVAGLNAKPYTNPSTADPNLPHFSEEVTVNATAPQTPTQQRQQSDTSAFFQGMGAQNQIPTWGTGVGQPFLQGFGMYSGWGSGGGFGPTFGGGGTFESGRKPWWIPD